MNLLQRIENPDIEQFIQAFSGIFRDIQQYSGILRDIKAYQVLRYIPFLKIKGHDCGKKGPHFAYVSVKFSIQNVVL